MRCAWVGDDPLYIKYHDEEWGKPNHDDRLHFEFIVLESAQAGLSWITVLRKRENYRKHYENFEPKLVAEFDDDKVEGMLKDPGIIRYRKKIEASINNARCFLKIQEEFGTFDNYIWKFVDHEPLVNQWKSLDEMPASTALSDEVSKDLKKRGFKFLGTTIIYSYLQAMGLINDHVIGCDYR